MSIGNFKYVHKLGARIWLSHFFPKSGSCLSPSAEGMGDLRRTTPAHQPESGAVFAAGHHLRWRWPCKLRPAGLSRADANSRRLRPHARRTRGEQAHTLTIGEAAHAYPFGAGASSCAADAIPTTLFLVRGNNASAPPNLTSMNPGTMSNVGGSQAHLNMQPYLTLSFCIALQGIFPSPT